MICTIVIFYFLFTGILSVKLLAESRDGLNALFVLFVLGFALMPVFYVVKRFKHQKE